MKQADVDKRVWASTAAMVRDADYDELLGTDFVDKSGATYEQIERAQRKVVVACELRAGHDFG